MVRSLLVEDLRSEDYEVAVFLVGEPAMIRLNENYLQHSGSTDVITFDYCNAELLAGDIFVCVDEALAQARKFRTSWQSEVVRYIIHGILHLSGYDDRRVDARRKMKRAEDKLLRGISARFNIRVLAAKGGRTPRH